MLFHGGMTMSPESFGSEADDQWRPTADPRRIRSRGAVAHLVYDFKAQKGPKVEFHSKVAFGRLASILENAVI